MAFSQSFCFSLLKAHDEIHHYAHDTLAHFNFFMERRLARMIKDYCGCTEVDPPSEGGFAMQKRHVISFLNMSIEKPTVPKTEGLSRGIRVMQLDGDALYPNEALLRGLTYSEGIFVDIKH